MASNNVRSNAKVLNSSADVQKYELGSFVNNSAPIPEEAPPSQAVLDTRELNGHVDPVLTEMRNLAAQISHISAKVESIENGGVQGRDIDAQVVQAIKDLKHYAAFFEQATFQMESKLLKTSISIAQKIISIEVGENSAKIARQTISHLLDKIKTASKVQIHLNPKDYQMLKDQLALEPYIELREDPNVAPGGVVIASDLGNFDGNIEAKVASMLETLDTVI
ncbi:FliH/SctL family protein [Arcobacter sp. YIC-464]|uniref:FliH/SctL family protein n=1 Tax=Arcobacter sp. YIC-464 TaxID=3376631 RepID=UPI003C1B5A93